MNTKKVIASVVQQIRDTTPCVHVLCRIYYITRLNTHTHVYCILQPIHTRMYIVFYNVHTHTHTYVVANTFQFSAIYARVWLLAVVPRAETLFWKFVNTTIHDNIGNDVFAHGRTWRTRENQIRLFYSIFKYNFFFLIGILYQTIVCGAFDFGSGCGQIIIKYRPNREVLQIVNTLETIRPRSTFCVFKRLILTFQPATYTYLKLLKRFSKLKK